MAECPESIEELEALEKLIPLCRKEILKQVEARKAAGTATSDRDAARQLAEETGRTEEGIRTAVKRARKVGSVNPPKPAPSSLKEITAQVKVGKVSDDDIKVMLDVVSSQIEEGRIPPRVASKLVTAAKRKRQDPSKHPNEEPPSEIKQLDRKLGFVTEQLQLLAEGSIKVAPDDERHLKSIRAKGPSIIWSFHDLGIDIQKVWRLIVGGKELENGGEAVTEPFDVIDVEGAVVN